MRELTFPGFLGSYVRSLSQKNTASLYALSQEAAQDNPRLREPLYLYALFSDKLPLLQKAAQSNPIPGFSEIVDRFDKDTVLSLLTRDDPALPEGCRKVWRSYLAQKNRCAAESDTKELMRQRILALQKENGLSTYRLYTDLGLNPGNINAWLKYGESSKVSLQTARRLYRYASGQQKN